MAEVAGVQVRHQVRNRPSALLLSWLLLLLPLLLAPRSLFASPSGDLSAWLKAQDATLGSAAGTIVIDHPGRIEAPLTLGAGHNLSVLAPLDWAATIRLSGSNAVQCASAAPITAHLAPFLMPGKVGMLLLAESVAHVRVSGCSVTSATSALLLAGYPVSDVDLTGNTLTGVMLLFVDGAPGSSQRLTLSKNVVTSTKPFSTYAGVQLNFAKFVTVTGNTFTNLLHGAMWWGGDSGAPGATLQQVTGAGSMTFIGNQCKNIGGACIWGSMGSDIVIRDNSADGCGDVCFDTEGGLRTQIVDNTALNCQNGCAAIFFFTDQTTISGNHFRAQAPGGGLIFIKNSSQDPSRHDHISMTNNELRCEPTPCRAVYQEAAGGMDFVGNEVRNGVWLPVGYAREVKIANNHLVYDQPLTGVSAAILAPSVIGGTALEVTGNRIESNAPQAPGTACIAASWSDFNATDTHLIAGNTCAGTNPFSLGLSVLSAGQNPGLVGVWILSANHFGSGSIQHLAKTPNERYFDLGQCGSTGCQVNQQAVNAVRALQGCSGGAPAAKSGTIPVCLGGVRGWGLVPLPR